MLTQAIPSLVNALAQSLPANVVSQIAQALGNCNQPVTQRAPVAISPQAATGQGGTAIPGTWNPADYSGLIPDWSQITGSVQNINQMQNVTNMTTMSFDQGQNNYGGSGFYFPTSNQFGLNSFYGGPTTYVGGNSQFSSVVTSNFTAGDIVIESINGTPAPGTFSYRSPAGPAGSPGGSRAAGAQGAAGAIGEAGRAGAFGASGAPGAFIPVIYQIPVPVFVGGGGGDFNLNPVSLPFLRATALRAKGKINVPKYSFDPETCQLSEDGTKDVDVDLNVGPIRTGNALVSV